MPEITIYVKGTRAQVLKTLASIPSAVRQGGAASNAMMASVGQAALTCIHKAFIVKSRGGTDDAGERWQPLSPKTIAYSRSHPGLPSPAVRANYRPSYALTYLQRLEWWGVYRGALSYHKGDKSIAARIAWAFMKRSGVMTLFDKYAHTHVNILHDTGLLFNSLSPNVQSKEQVFHVNRGEVEIGTNRKGAKSLHKHRRLWPKPNKWPSAWNQSLLEKARLGIVDVIIKLVDGTV